jgi:hypothetical protein
MQPHSRQSAHGVGPLGSQVIGQLYDLRTLIQISDQDGGYPGTKSADNRLRFRLGQILAPIGEAQRKAQMGHRGAAQQGRFLLVSDSCNLNAWAHNTGDIVRACEG